MNNIKIFMEKKNVEISFKRYLIDALSFMSLGLFASLLIGTIFNTLGESLNIKLFTDTIYPLSKQVTGPMIAVAIANGLGSPPLVMFSTGIVGALANDLGGPMCVYLSTIICVEFGKLVSKETKVDIIITPTITILIGVISAQITGPIISEFMNTFGEIIVMSTNMQPILMGMIISTLMGIALTLPISSAAISVMLNLEGLAAGAATVGCCCQMIGFAVMSFRENGFGGLVAQGIGTSMIQMPNIMKNYKIWTPPIISSMILGPISTVIFKMENISISAGMGTSGFVGQIGTFNAMENSNSSTEIFIKILLLHFILPSIITLITYKIMKNKKLIKEGDLKLNI